MGGDDFLSVFHLLHPTHETLSGIHLHSSLHEWLIFGEYRNTEEQAIQFSVKYLGGE